MRQAWGKYGTRTFNQSLRGERIHEGLIYGEFQSVKKFDSRICGWGFIGGTLRYVDLSYVFLRSQVIPYATLRVTMKLPLPSLKQWHYETSWNIVGYYEMLWNIRKHLGTLWYIMKHYETFGNILEHCETWNTMKH